WEDSKPRSPTLSNALQPAPKPLATSHYKANIADSTRSVGSRQRGSQCKAGHFARGVLQSQSGAHALTRLLASSWLRRSGTEGYLGAEGKTLMAMCARGAVTVMAVVAAHAAVRLHLKNGVEQMLENTLLM